MKNARYFRFVVLILVAVATGCAGNRVNPAQLPADELYQRANERFEARDFGDAIPLLEVFVQQYLGDPRAPQARYNLGRAYMARREYVTAASHFQRLVEDFPSSPLNVPARFATCESYVLLSPRPQLDQEYTEVAIAHCESVATNFPGTPEAEKAAGFLTELREKLAGKAYDNGAFYMRRKAYDAAVVYFNEVLRNFPTSRYMPATLARLAETYTLMGYVEEADAARERLLEEFPDSPEAQQLRPQ